MENSVNSNSTHFRCLSPSWNQLKRCRTRGCRDSRQGFHPAPRHKAINHMLPSDHNFSSVSYKHSSSVKWNMSFPRLLDFLVCTVEGNICRHMACRLLLEKHFENWTWIFFSPIMCRWSGLLTLNHVTESQNGRGWKGPLWVF